MEQTLKKSKGRAFSTNAMVKISILGVLAYIIMFIETPVPFFPPFLKMDFSDLPAIIGGFALGPIAGLTIEFIKNILHFATKSGTSGIGELANFMIGGAFVVTSSYLYKRTHTKKGAMIALVIGTLCMAATGVVMNATVLLPFFANFMGGADKLIAMGQGLNANVTGMWTFALYLIGPFNLFKGVVLSVVTAVLYKKVSPLIKMK